MTKAYKDLNLIIWIIYEITTSKNTNLFEDASTRKMLWSSILEKHVSKVEHLFSTCTKKVKYRISTQETLEKDQGIDRREKRILLLLWRREGRKIQVPSTCIYTVGGGYSQNPRADQLDWAKTTLPINQSSLAHKHAMDENPRWGAHLDFVQA